MALNIAPKQDDPQRLLALNGVPLRFWLSAEEINSLIKTLTELEGGVTSLYKGEFDYIEEMEAAHPLPEPGSYAHLRVVNGDDIYCRWDNTSKKWVQDGLVKDQVPVKVATADNILAVLQATGTKYYGTKNGVAGVWDLPAGGGGGGEETYNGFIINYFSSGYQGGLTYKPVANFEYQGQAFTASPTLVASTTSIPAGEKRFDALVLNADGTITLVQGIPAVNPVEPDIDTITQYKAARILLSSNAVAPDAVTLSKIYTENGGIAGGEWDALINIGGSRWNLTAPGIEGAYAIKGTALQSQDRLLFTPAAPIAINNFTEVSLAIKNENSNEGEKLRLAVEGDYQDPNTGVISTRTLALPLLVNYGYDPANVTTVQFVSIPVAGLGIMNVQRLVLYYYGTGLTATIDSIKFNNAGTAPPQDFATLGYVNQQDAALQNQINNHEGRVQSLEASIAGGALVAYANMPALYAAQAQQVANGSYRVDDASAHPQVNAGRAWFDYKGTTNGNASDYILRSEEESMNLDAQLTAIENRLTAVENGKANKYGKRTVLPGSQIDWADGVDVHTKTITAALALTEINLPQGANVFIKKLVVNGNHPVTMPGAHYVWKGGEAGGISDAYVFDCINGNTGSLRIEYTITPDA